MACKTNNSYPFANLKMENSLHKMSIGGAIQELEHSHPLTIIDKNSMSVLIPSSFKFFSPILAKICSSFSSTDDVFIITPDCTGSALLGLYELVSSGITNNEIIYQKPESVEKIINAGTLFGININREAILWDFKTEKLEYSELSAPSEELGLKIESIFKSDFNSNSAEMYLLKKVTKDK